MMVPSEISTVMVTRLTFACLLSLPLLPPPGPLWARRFHARRRADQLVGADRCCSVPLLTTCPVCCLPACSAYSCRTYNSTLGRQLSEAKRFGQKTGAGAPRDAYLRAVAATHGWCAGFYEYKAGSPAAKPDAKLAKFVEQVRAVFVSPGHH